MSILKVEIFANLLYSSDMPFSLDPQPGDDEFECANCGAYFHYSLTRCPDCGVNVYEPDLEDEGESNSPQPRTKRPSGFLWKIKRIFNTLMGRSDLADDLFGVYQEQIDLYHDLLQKVSGDSSTAESLISYERQRAPNGNRTAWLKRAIWRWEKDNRSTKF